MTKLRPGKPLVRLTEAFERTDQIIVTLHPRHLTLNLRGASEGPIDLDYTAILNFARRLKTARAAK